MNSNKKIIYYIQDLPPYEMHINEKRPPANYDTKNGSWVGFFSFPATRQINGILSVSNKYEFEVWQPDLRADKIYTHTYENGLTHKLFPAVLKSNGLNKKIVYSELVVEEMRKYTSTQNILLQTTGLRSDIDWLIEEFKDNLILANLRSTVYLPHLEILKLRKDIKRYRYLLADYFGYKKKLKRIDYVVYQNDENLDIFKKYYKGAMAKITSGIDFNKFVKLDKNKCRTELDLPQDKKIFLTVGRLNGLKQNSQLLDVLINLSKKYDFLVVIIGNPDKQSYLKKLKRKAKPLIEEGKVKFTGFKGGKELVKYYSAADLFIMSATAEGGPVTSMEAIACELPIISTRTGFASEVLEKYNKGIILGTRDYASWEVEIEKFLNNEKIELLDRNLAKKYFSLEVVSEKFVAVYDAMYALK